MTPLFSVIVTVSEGSGHLLPFTLDSVFGQGFAEFEVIVVDATGEDLSFYLPKIKVVRAEKSNLFAMFNQGAAVAQGSYLQFFQAGEYLLSHHILSQLAQFFEANSEVDLLSTGSLVRHSVAPTQVLLEPLTRERLKSGKIGALSSYVFRKSAFESVGKFRTFFALQGGFDLVCRIFLLSSYKKIFMRRVLTDYEYHILPPGKILRQFFETLFIIVAHFGLSRAFVRCLSQQYLRFLYWGWRHLKSAFWKKSPVN